MVPWKHLWINKIYKIGKHFSEIQSGVQSGRYGSDRFGDSNWRSHRSLCSTGQNNLIRMGIDNKMIIYQGFLKDF